LAALIVAIFAAMTGTVATATAAWQASLLRRQLRQDNRVRSAVLHQGLANHFIQLDLIFVERPHLRQYFYDNVDPTETEAQAQAMALAEYIVDMAESCVAAEGALPDLAGDWDEFLGHLFRSSPPLRAYWAEFGHLFPAEVTRALTGPPIRPKPRAESAKEAERATGLVEPGGAVTYTASQAASYSAIELAGSTYQISLAPAISALGALDRKTVLDFGSGTGRTAMALRTQGAARVCAVDKSRTMLRAASRDLHVLYVQAREQLPLRDQSMDAALCANVLCEFSDFADIQHACREIARVLVPDAPFVVVVPHPDSYGADFLSYRYLATGELRSGDPVECLIKGADSFLVQDYYWSTADYVDALACSGFEVQRVYSPLAAAHDDVAWKDETVLPPDLVILCRRGGRDDHDVPRPAGAGRPPR
jgi:SAM-dependent methyltransferase